MLRVIALLAFALPALAAEKAVTLKGDVTWPKTEAIPKPVLVANLPAGIGPIFQDDIVIDPASRGLKNVWVYLRPDSDDRAAQFKDVPKAKPTNHNVQFPFVQFLPKVLAIRDGDTITFDNNSPRLHNIKLDADEPSPSFNRAYPPRAAPVQEGPFFTQSSPAVFECTVHPWMTGKFMVFNHPWHAVTDSLGHFEITNVPAGKYRVVYRHEKGYHKGRDGRLGGPVEIKDAGNGTMEMTPLEYEMPKP